MSQSSDGRPSSDPIAVREFRRIEAKAEMTFEEQLAIRDAVASVGSFSSYDDSKLESAPRVMDLLVLISVEWSVVFSAATAVTMSAKANMLAYPKKMAAVRAAKDDCCLEGRCCSGMEYCCNECDGSCRCSVHGKCNAIRLF